MPTERVSLGAAVANGVVYAVGGTHYEMISGKSTQAPTNSNEAYDPVTDTWTAKAPMQTPLTSFGIAVYQNKIYCIGGTTNEVYDTRKDTWQLMSPMPNLRTALQANVVDGKIYLIGGVIAMTSGPEQFSTLNEVYDPATDTWNAKAPLPLAVANYASAVVNDLIYIISGRSKNGSTTNIIDAVQVYDPQSDSWTASASIPIPVSTAAATAIAALTTKTDANDQESTEALFVIGGLTKTDPFHAANLTQIYYPQNNTWASGAPLLYPRGGLAAVSIDSSIFAIGGGSHVFFNPQSNANQQYGPNITQNSSNAVPTPTQSSMPTPTPAPTQTPSLPPNPSPSIPEFLVGFPFAVLLLCVVATAVYLRQKHYWKKPYSLRA